jgi:putative transposase
VTGTPARREAAGFLIGREVSKRRACWWLNVSRSRLEYASRKTDGEVVETLMARAKEHLRYGLRRLHALMRRQGEVVDLKRVRRVCRRHGLPAAEAEAAKKASRARCRRAL